MSSSSRHSPLQLGNIEDALREALGTALGESSKEEDVPSGGHTDQSLAELFVSYEVDDLMNRKAAQELLAKENARAEKQRQLEEERNQRAVLEYQLFDILPEGAYSMDDVRKALKHHKYDVQAAFEELHSALLVLDEAKRTKTKAEPVVNSYATANTWPSLEQSVGTPRKSASARRPSMEHEVLEDIHELERAGKKKFAACNHHTAQAYNYPKHSKEAGAISHIARTERREAEDLFHEGEFSPLCPSERTYHLLDVAIGALRKYRPSFRYLELIPGKGLNNKCKQPILKQAIIQWLKQEDIQYECPSNEGVVVVDLYTVPPKFGRYY
ncbi:hypothetical protein M3Y99_00773900 [Aphelenchoides fujianensis]|nr:hypothetical protein M3Y99_00773900 [Aphelenchoides fujianensis]